MPGGGSDKSTSPAYQRENSATALTSRIGRPGVLGEGRQRGVPHRGGIPQQLERDQRCAVIARPLCHRGADGSAGRIPGHGHPVRVTAQPGGVLGDPKRCGPSVFDGGGVGVLRRQPVVDGHHDRVGADRVLASRAVVAVEVAHDEAAAVKVQHDGRRGVVRVRVGSAWRPIDPDGDRSRPDPGIARSSTRSSGCSGRRGRSRNRWRAASTPSSVDSRKGTASSTFCRMGSIAGFSSAVLSKLGMDVPYAPRLVATGWVVAGWAALGYGVYLTVLALGSPPGTELTGHWVLQPRSRRRWRCC